MCQQEMIGIHDKFESLIKVRKSLLSIPPLFLNFRHEEFTPPNGDDDNDVVMPSKKGFRMNLSRCNLMGICVPSSSHSYRKISA